LTDPIFNTLTKDLAQVPTFTYNPMMS
jgi:hypothetical protein